MAEMPVDAGALASGREKLGKGISWTVGGRGHAVWRRTRGDRPASRRGAV